MLLHVGVAKTGTTYLQRILAINRARLKAAGYLYPGDSPHSHFRAAMDLRGGSYGGHDYERSRGVWDEIAREVNGFDGPALVSHESMAKIGTETRQRAVESFAGTPVGVIVTVRDLARQIPAVWQENVKNRNTTPYDQFLEGVFRPKPRAKFWQAQDVGAVAGRWADQVGADDVTIVTVPPPGSDRELLWSRMREAAGLPDVSYVVPDSHGNPSLGVAESEVLRRMNYLFPKDLPWTRYEGLVKRSFAAQVMSQRRAEGPLVLPAQYEERARERSAESARQIAAAGYRVVGDLDDLVPAVAPGTAGVQPDDIATDRLFEVTLAMLCEAAMQSKAPPSRGSADEQDDEAGIVRRLAGRLRRG